MSRFSRAVLVAGAVVVALAPVTGEQQCDDSGSCVTVFRSFWGLALGSQEALAWIPAVLIGTVLAVFVFRKSKRRKKKDG